MKDASGGRQKGYGEKETGTGDRIGTVVYKGPVLRVADEHEKGKKSGRKRAMCDWGEEGYD